MKVDIGFFTETKIVNEYYTKDCCDYAVFATHAPSRFQGGVALFYRYDNPQFSVEGIQSYGPNVIACTLVSGTKRWSLIGAYIAPSETNGSTLEHVDHAIRNHDNHPLILLGDLNVDFHTTSISPHPRDEEIIMDLSFYDLHDVANSFLHPRGTWTWSQHRQGAFLRSTTDYILTDTPRYFVRWNIKIPRGYHSNHRCVVAEIRLAPQREHFHYLRFRRRCPLVLERPITKADHLFESLNAFRSSPESKTQRDRSWIAPDTWKVIDRRATLRRAMEFSTVLPRPLTADQFRDYEQEMKSLHREIQRLLRRDRRKRAERVSTEIQSHLAAGRTRDAYSLLATWYKHRGGRLSRPTLHDLNRVSAEYKKLFASKSSCGDDIPVHISPFPVNDAIPDECEIIQALKRLRKRTAPGPSGMRVEDLLRWRDEEPQAWTIVLCLVSTAFTDGLIPQSFSWGILVLLPKSTPGEHRGIALLEVLWKLCAMIIHLHLTQAVEFHNDIHGFCPHHGTGTATLEAKLLMQLCYSKGLPLYQVFLDLTKAYDSLDHSCTLLKLTSIALTIL